MARLAPRVKNFGINTAISYYQRAMKYCTDFNTKAKIIYEIANSYAQKRTSLDLKIAKEWYQNGYNILSSIPDELDRVIARIRFDNGLALVEYRQGNNIAALILEKEAELLAKKYPSVQKWAFPLLNNNLSILMEKKYNNLDEAIIYLTRNIEDDDIDIRENSSIELARLYYDRHEYVKVIDLLEKLYEKENSFFINKSKEFLGRTMFTVSLIVTNQKSRARKQMGSLNDLYKVLNIPNDNDIVSTITKLIS